MSTDQAETPAAQAAATPAPVAEPLPWLVTYRQGAKLLGVGLTTLRRWIAAELLPPECVVRPDDKGDPRLAAPLLRRWVEEGCPRPKRR